MQICKVGRLISPALTSSADCMKYFWKKKCNPKNRTLQIAQPWSKQNENQNTGTDRKRKQSFVCLEGM